MAPGAPGGPRGATSLVQNGQEAFSNFVAGGIFKNYLSSRPQQRVVASPKEPREDKKMIKAFVAALLLLPFTH